MNTSQTLAIIATIIGATWVLSEKISDFRVDLHKEIAEVRVEICKESGTTRDEFRKEIGNVRVDVGYLLGDVANAGSKLDEFKESHRREHDLSRNPAANEDEENSTSAN